MFKKDYAGRLKNIQKLILIILPAAVFFICLCLGRMYISPKDVLSAIAGKRETASDPASRTITVIRSIRIPRLILAAVTGTGLSVAGCTFQNLYRNPLATPDTLGVASGAGFGACLALIAGFDMKGVQISALLSGLSAVILTRLSGIGSKNEKHTPVLAGIIIGSLFNSLISLVKFAADTESQLPAITYWLMGSMESAGYDSLRLGVPPVIICTAVLLLLRWKMNLLPLSEDEAVSLGVNIRALHPVCELCAAMITASCVSMCGQVGWVGLIVPHICRMIYGGNNVSLIPACVSIGAAFMMAIDTAARTVSPKEIPISVLTAIAGAPFFICLLKRRGGWEL